MASYLTQTTKNLIQGLLNHQGIATAILILSLTCRQVCSHTYTHTHT